MPVDESAARTVAETFARTQSARSSKLKGAAIGKPLQLLHIEHSTSSPRDAAFYIYNTDIGFIIVAGDDRTQGILAHGDAPIDMQNLPDGMRDFLNQYKRQIDYLFQHPELDVKRPALNESPYASTSVEPMLTTIWGQDFPFCNLCPIVDGDNCLTGCAATALAQIMHYWQHPSLLPALDGYTTRTLQIQVEALPGTVVDWDNMLDEYPFFEYTQDQASAVATLMRYVGQASQMNYTLTNSTTNINTLLQAAKTLDYDKNASLKYRDAYFNNEWIAMMLTELNEGRPIYYSSQDDNIASRHAFVIDGYDADLQQFHINWGWDGRGNGYFALDAFNVNSHAFNTDQNMIIGLRPQPPLLTLDTSILTFEAIVGEVESHTFTVQGINLTGNLSLELHDTSGFYSIDKTSISAEEATEGVVVTVTCAPTAPLVNSASITISGGGVASQSVHLNTTASPSATVNPQRISLYTNVGLTKSYNFTVKGNNLHGDLTLTLSGDTDVFTLGKTTLGIDEALAGASVSVSYHPVERGTNSAVVTVSGGGINPQYITISGKASKPELIVSADTLDFTTIFGETVTKSFDVFMQDIPTDLELVVEGHYHEFLLDKEYISYEEACEGVTVAVTYDPWQPGLNSGTISFRDRNDDEIYSISLSGHALQPIINSRADTLDFEDVEIGYPQVIQFPIYGEDLMQDITLSISGNNQNQFTVSPSTISIDDATDNDVLVSVTCAPTVATSLNAVLTLSSSGAQDVTIPIRGQSHNVAATITSQTAERFYTAGVGEWLRSTEVIHLPNAEVPTQPVTPGVVAVGPTSNGYSVSIEGDGSFVALITRSSATVNTCDVRIIYHPTSAGQHTATAHVTCKDGRVVTIHLTGEGVVDISGVTRLISLLLYGVDDEEDIIDVNDDGEMDIADVTTLINMLLTGD